MSSKCLKCGNILCLRIPNLNEFGLTPLGCKHCGYTTSTPQYIEANNKYIQEVHKDFINTHNLNVKDALILSKFLEFMTEHE